MDIQPVSQNPGKSRIFYGWYIVGASWLMFFLTNAVSVGIFFKPILEEFQVGRATLSAVYTLALLIYAAATPFIGRLIDRFGPRLMLLICAVTQTASSTVNGLASGLWHLFIGRILFDFKSLQAGQVLINRWFIKNRGRAQGIAATGVPLGALILTPLSQYLIITWGWRETMFFWAGIFLIVLLPLAFFMRNNPKEKGYLPDGEFTGGENSVAVRAKPGKAGYITAGQTEGLSLTGAVKTAPFWLVSATQLICGIGCGFMMTHIVIFATDMGYSEMVGATLISVQGGLNLAGVMLTGHISDRYARNKVLALTHVIRSMAFFTAVVFILRGGGSLWMLYLAMVLFGLGWFTTSPLSSGLAADLFGGRRLGTIIGVMMSCHTVGTALGSYAGGITYELTGSYFPFFIIQAALELLAAVCAFLINKR
jgi:MFS family permease